METTAKAFPKSVQILTPEALVFLEILEHEFQMQRERSFYAVKHQAFAGAGYFDQVQMTVTDGQVSTTALKGSTEEAQFRSL